MVNFWNHVVDPNAILPKKLAPEVLRFLETIPNQQILSWLDDSYSLLKYSREARSSTGTAMEYYDYSFMITPAFKALELWIINIAPYLGVGHELVEKAKDRGNFRFLNDSAIQPLVDKVVESLEDRSKTEKSLRSSLNALSSYLTNLRHTPAHCSEVIKSPDKADTVYNQIVGAIDDITSLLISAGVIKEDPHAVESSGRAIWTNRPRH